jgi:hypothetical protein
MRTSSHLLTATVLASTVAGHAAIAQTLTPTKARLASIVVPLATTSFTPYAASGMLGNAAIQLGLDGVSFSAGARTDGTIIFNPYYKSAAYLNSAVLLPNGNYSVQFAFSKVAVQPAAFTITRGGSAVLASCSLPAVTTTQTCDSGSFTVSDGKLGVTLSITQGVQAVLAQVTVNRLP